MRIAPLLTLAIVLAAGVAGCLGNKAQLPDPVTNLPATVSPGNYTVPAVPQVDAKVLLADHAVFVKKNNLRAGTAPTHESARVDLMERFTSYGLDAHRFNFTSGGLPQADIMGIKWGVDREHWVFVGGHYDTTTWDSAVGPQGDASISQGAYDDGSGTMITMHLAKAFSNSTPYYTIAFVAYDGEERGIQGATAIVQAIQEANFTYKGVTPTIVGDLDLDMIGINWPGTSAPINMMDNTKAGADLVKAWWADKKFPAEQLIEKPGLKLGSSDYAAFWGITDPAPVPTIFFISDFEEIGIPTAGLAPGAAHSPAGAYPFWHMTDTVETMTAMAGGPDALLAGFQNASDLAAYVVHFMAEQPTVVLDATPR